MAETLRIPDFCLVALVGASGSGKSTFARKHFRATEVLSSDAFRGLVADDENDQAATRDAFEVLHHVLAKRLAARRLTVVDATNVQPEARKPIVAAARQHHALPVAILLDLPRRVCEERNRARPDRDFGPHVIGQQVRQLRQSVRTLGREGFRQIHVLRSPEEVDAAAIERRPLWCDLRAERGPFDVIGDVHGCLSELLELLRTLGYAVESAAAEDGSVRRRVEPPAGRKAVFVGDLVDRGPDTPGVLQVVMDMVAAGTALCVPGNHDVKLLRMLSGRDVRIAHGLERSLEQLQAFDAEHHQRIARFIDQLVSHYVLDGGRLVVAHAGMKESLQGRASAVVRDFALYGETTGETDELGLPVRHNWAAEYRGRAMVVYGHTPVAEPDWLNGTVNIDTGCVFGGKLSALRYPEKQVVSVPAERMYFEPARPFLPVAAAPPPLTAQQEVDDLLDAEDVLGKRIVATRLHHNVTVREENALAALEVMSRFAINPKWLIYLPPTMSPPQTSRRPGFLEHPEEAFGYFRQEGVPRVVCEEKHMGSRAVAIVCRDEEAARRRFGVTGEGCGACYSRTGRRLFDGPLNEALLARLRTALDAARLWDELDSDWVCLDCEVLPWSAKAQELLRHQYAAVGAASRVATGASVAALERAAARIEEAKPLLTAYLEKRDHARRFVAAYRQYVWEVVSPQDIVIAPFHVLASDGKVHSDRDHLWHLGTIARLCQAAGDDGGPRLLETAHRVVELNEPASEEAAIAWWSELTARGGEGMVVKPFTFIARGRRGLVQPAVKCRGPEYLRIIYGPEYSLPANLDRLRQRGLGAKRSLALRELALGLEGLERFIAREPLRRVHECVFGVLALESEPVDPRL